MERAGVRAFKTSSRIPQKELEDSQSKRGVVAHLLLATLIQATNQRWGQVRWALLCLNQASTTYPAKSPEVS